MNNFVKPASRADYLTRPGTLAVVKPLVTGADVATASPEVLDIYVMVDGDGPVIGFNGHVDLGTGIQTALAQIVAEELDVPFDRVRMVLGHSAVTPDQGPTIASETIQLKAKPLRAAAAQARRWLIARASALSGARADEITIEDGRVILAPPDNRTMSFGEIIGDDPVRLLLDEDAPTKPVSRYRLVGHSQPRVDLTSKATGDLVYVHDMRLPGMLHGRVVRPPYAGFDMGEHVGRSFVSLDEASIAHIPGIVKVVRLSDFVGIVAEREEQAEAAMRALKVEWRESPRRPDLGHIETALTRHESTARIVKNVGDVDRAIAEVETFGQRLTRTYVWPYQMHASIGPSCALADFRDDGLTVWSGTQNPLPMRADLAILLDLPVASIEVVRMEAAGCYGRNCADDVTADAALLARAVSRPVRVQLTRDQEHQWEPKGAAQVMTSDGGLDAAGHAIAYDFSTRYPSNKAPVLARLLTGKTIPDDFINPKMGDRTAVGPYDYANERVICHDMLPIARASWFRGVSALPNSFAHECYIDELASMAGVDPIEFRLRYLRQVAGAESDYRRARELIEQLADHAGWKPHVGAQMIRDADGMLHGRGFAYALYMHSAGSATPSAWSAWVADVVVNPGTGEVALTKITVGQDSGLMINPDGVRHQIHGNVVQSISRVLKEEVTFNDVAVIERDWGAYPIATFADVPPIDVMMIPRPDEPPMGVGESASVPSAAAIANAIYDATGVRFYEVPFTPDKILAGLRAAGVADAPPAALVAPPQTAYPKPFKRWLPLAAAMLGAIGSIGVATLPIRSAIDPILQPDPAVYSAATIERGRQLAAIGGCLNCHTASDGAPLAGGLAIETPFGHVYSTNITPDVATGIGGWSFPAFERAMREGVARDGRHLFPAFPFTAFAKTSEADMQALYAYLMAQPGVSNANMPATLRAPFGFRPLMSLWNTAFLDSKPFQSNPALSDLWNRGAYLVEGLGHCAACHSPRNALGAEMTGEAYLSGGVVDGWQAPALNVYTSAPIPWTEQAFYDYLRTGFSHEHGAAAGPMAPVVAELKVVPDVDIRAMAHYLGSLNPAAANLDTRGMVRALEAAADARGRELAPMPGATLFEGACRVCHDQANGPLLFGVKPSLTLSSAVHAETPDTFVRVLLEGAHADGIGDLGAMPSFAYHLDDAQIADITAYARARFAPDKPAWENVLADAARLRGNLVGH